MTTPSTDVNCAEGAVSVHTLAGQGRIGLMDCWRSQAILGYEWLVSGAAKSRRFRSDFADQLREFSQNAPDWFRRGLDALVVPAPTLWAISIELAEFLIGLTLHRGRSPVGVVVRLASAEGTSRRGRRPDGRSRRSSRCSSPSACTS